MLREQVHGAIVDAHSKDHVVAARCRDARDAHEVDRVAEEHVERRVEVEDHGWSVLSRTMDGVCCGRSVRRERRRARRAHSRERARGRGRARGWLWPPHGHRAPRAP